MAAAKIPATLDAAEKSAAQEMAELDTRREALAEQIKAQNKPLIDEATALLSDPSTKAAMVRLAEIGQALPPQNPYVNLRMMLNSVTQAFGGAVNTLNEASK